MRIKAKLHHQLPLPHCSITESLTHNLILEQAEDANNDSTAEIDQHTSFAYVHRGLTGDRRSKTRLGSAVKKEEIKEKIKDRIKGEIENLIRRNFHMRKAESKHDSTRMSRVYNP